MNKKSQLGSLSNDSEKTEYFIQAFSDTRTATPETTTITENEKTTEGQDKLTGQSCLFWAYS